jgi:hypothetical protein
MKINGKVIEIADAALRRFDDGLGREYGRFGCGCFLVVLCFVVLLVGVAASQHSQLQDLRGELRHESTMRERLSDSVYRLEADVYRTQKDRP